MRVANCRAFFVRRYDQSRGRRAWMCPPPRRIPLRREPARALPVPFCRYIFFVVPCTSVRFFVRTVPRRRLFWYITTASWINCLLIRGAIWAGSISYFPTSAPVRS